MAFLGAAPPSLRGDAPLIFLHSLLFYSSKLTSVILWVVSLSLIGVIRVKLSIKLEDDLFIFFYVILMFGQKSLNSF